MLCFGGLCKLQRAGSVCQPCPCCRGIWEALEWCILILSIDLPPKSLAFGCQSCAHAACPGSLVLWRIPPLLRHVRQRRVITPSFAPAFPPSCCPGVLGHSLGIPQQSQSLLGSREMLCAMQPFLPFEQQVRSGLALQHAPH